MEIPQEKEEVDYVVCQICGRDDLKQINNRHLLSHGLTLEEYRNLYPEAVLISESTRQKISIGRKGIKFSDERRKNLRKTKSGKNHPFFGKKRPEHSKKMKGKFTGDKNPAKRPEVRKKISESHKEGYRTGRIKNPMYGKKHTRESRLKMSDSRMGMKLSRETRQKMSASHTGMKFTEERKKNISDSLKGREFTEEWKRNISESRLKGFRTGRIELSKNAGRGIKGFRPDLNCFFRINWEANIARVLNYHQIKWLYEPKRFDLGKHTYLPDFYLPEKDIWIEVKGYIRPENEERVAYQIHEFSKDHRLLVIDGENYRQLELKYKSLIPMWDQMQPRNYNLSKLLKRRRRN